MPWDYDTIAASAFIVATVVRVVRRSLYKMVVLCIVFPMLPMLTLVAINSMKPSVELLATLSAIAFVSYLRRKVFYR